MTGVSGQSKQVFRVAGTELLNDSRQHDVILTLRPRATVRCNAKLKDNSVFMICVCFQLTVEVDRLSARQGWNLDVRMHDRGEIWLGGCRSASQLTDGDYSRGFGGSVQKVSKCTKAAVSLWDFLKYFLLFCFFRRCCVAKISAKRKLTCQAGT